MRLKELLIVIALVAPGAAHSEPVGYASLPLTVPVRTYELRHFSSVGELASYLLSRIGYSLVTGFPAPADAPSIAGRPVNPAIFKQDILTIQEILVAAIGSDNKLIVDVPNQLVSFEAIDDPFSAPENPSRQYFTGRVSELNR